MSDPASDGFTCHGPMRTLEIVGVYDGTAAFYCPICGCWRHAFSPGDDRRVIVEQWMDQHLLGLIEGEAGEVA